MHLPRKGGQIYFQLPYKVPVTIEGVLYTPRFMSGGSAERIAVGANVDLADVKTLKGTVGVWDKLVERLKGQRWLA
ncbi:hypothetical protein [Pseudomonas synxantha]|uniref:hypothetical protein n=1 Tax=Pseudomonas synxantha TaxID=47883 RepID=UPI001C0A8BDB|nr:hypothetical protein [Pseudomonas synxantha]VCU64655.1 Hypothetical new protein [Pseudomonas synxantha]